MENVENKFVAVSEDLAGAGSMVYWTLRDDLTLSKLKAAFEKHDLNTQWLPKATTTEVAFTRALNDMQDGDLFTERLETTKEVALVMKEEQDGLPSYTTLAKWKLDGFKPVCTMGDEDGTLTMILEASYQQELLRIPTNTISVWLATLVPQLLDGVSLRATGGFYFVPPKHVELWKKLKAAVSEASNHTLYNIPMMSCDDASETIMDAVLADAAKQVELLEKFIAESGDSTRASTFTGQAEKAKEFKAKLQRYEKLLNRAMPDLTEKLENLSAGLFVAARRVEAK
jgi:hypothetical protein